MNKTVLITGATSGLGLEFVKLFGKDGYDLILVARNEGKLKEIQESFSDGRVTIVPLDLSRVGAAEELYSKLTGRRMDALVNNAGFGLLGEFSELALAKQSEMIRLNITALTELTHVFLPELKKTKGRIMNVASTAAFQPGPMMAVYYATKAYVLSFSEALVEELRGTGVTVTTLCPGATKTNFGTVASVEKTKMFSRAMNASVVAKQGYEAMKQGKGVVVTGAMNQAGAIAAKFLPRRLGAKIAKYVAQER